MKDIKNKRHLSLKYCLLALVPFGWPHFNLEADFTNNDYTYYDPQSYYQPQIDSSSNFQNEYDPQNNYYYDPQNASFSSYYQADTSYYQPNNASPTDYYYEPLQYEMGTPATYETTETTDIQPNEAEKTTSYPFETSDYYYNENVAQADPITAPPQLIFPANPVQPTNQIPLLAPESQPETPPMQDNRRDAAPPVRIQEPLQETQTAPPPSPPTSQQAPQQAPQQIKTNPTSQAVPNQSPPPPTIITPTSPDEAPLIPEREGATSPGSPGAVGPINFNNVSMIEYIRFISRVSNKNFIFEEEDIQFTVTIISEEPTTIENLMTALLQELQIRDLSLIEQGNSIIIHRNPRVRSPGRIVADEDGLTEKGAEIITRVFRLNTLDPLKAAEIIKPLISDNALVEVLRDSNNLIITDIIANVNKIAQLISSLDAPNSGVTVGQYVVHSGFVDSLVDLASKILFPIAQGNPFVLVPHPPSNSIYIVSNPFIVEKALAILQNLDTNEGKTKIFSLKGLQPSGYNPETGTYAGAPGAPGVPSQAPVLPPPPEFPPGRGPSVFNEASEFMPGGISATSRWSRELPAGHIERTVFFIYKLKYRRGDLIDVSLRKIANSLMTTGIANIDLVSAINSVQWLESSNSLIFTGTVPALEKIRDLILEIDTPLHQVYIEMLILDTTLADSLTYGVDWGVLFGGGNTSGGETFLTPPHGKQILDTLNPHVGSVPDAKPLLHGEGFNLGIIGKHLTHNGMHFSTISALVRALHSDEKAHIILNPRIITEDNVTAEIFVGETDRYKTQSISNDFGSVITNNFQFIDVGTTLRVTPLIGNNGVITLDIIEEVTSPALGANLRTTSSQDVNLVPVLHKNRTTTRIHIPNGFFVVMSGLIDTREERFKNEIPCLGMIPMLGGAGKFKKNHDRKRNLMIFIRPVIVDTETELEDITKRQQDVYRDKCKWLRAWNYEVDEALDFFNIKPTVPDEIGCQLK